MRIDLFICIRPSVCTIVCSNTRTHWRMYLSTCIPNTRTFRCPYDRTVLHLRCSSYHVVAEIRTLWSTAVQFWSFFWWPRNVFSFTFTGNVCSHFKQKWTIPGVMILTRFCRQYSVLDIKCERPFLIYRRETPVFWKITLFTFKNAYIILPPPHTCN